jgi:hypothetical protein
MLIMSENAINLKLFSTTGDTQPTDMGRIGYDIYLYMTFQQSLKLFTLLA